MCELCGWGRSIRSILCSLLLKHRQLQGNNPVTFIEKILLD